MRCLTPVWTVFRLEVCFKGVRHLEAKVSDTWEVTAAGG